MKISTTFFKTKNFELSQRILDNNFMKALLLTLAIFLFVIPNAYAQEFHISVEPTVIQIDSTPPAKFEAPFQLKNLSNSSITLTPKFIPIEPREDGKVSLILNEEEDLANFIKDKLVILDNGSVVNEVELRAGETKQLTLFMDVAKGNPAGDFYFSLVFLSGGGNIDESSASSIPAGIGMNVLVSIGPKSETSAQIQEFETKRLIGSGPVFFSLKLNNTGKHLIQPEGNIIVKNLFGKTVGDIKILPQYVLANSSRYLIDSLQASPSAQIQEFLAQKGSDNPVAIWTEKFLMGPYTAQVNLHLEEGGNVVTRKITFFAVPVQIVVIISGIIFVVLGILIRINSKLRKKPLI